MKVKVRCSKFECWINIHFKTQSRDQLQKMQLQGRSPAENWTRDFWTRSKLNPRLLNPLEMEPATVMGSISSRRQGRSQEFEIRGSHGVPGGMSPRKILKSWVTEMPFPVFCGEYFTEFWRLENVIYKYSKHKRHIKYSKHNTWMHV